jgi:hypothetical protein
VGCEVALRIEREPELQQLAAGGGRLARSRVVSVPHDALNDEGLREAVWSAWPELLRRRYEPRIVAPSSRVACPLMR